MADFFAPLESDHRCGELPTEESGTGDMVLL